MITESVQESVRVMPELPGVYQFYDTEGGLLYIGKAKSLKKRVSSYFNRTNQTNNKLRTLVRKIASIKFVVVDSESDALLLENVLIKKHQPKYNILLKDDKTYPWICIKNEPFPRVFSTRNYIEDGSIYFGPYTSGRLVKTLLDLTKTLFPLRTCSLNLSQQMIAKGKYKPCLEYQIGNCLAPCIGLQEEFDYRFNIDAIKKILQGNLSDVLKWLNQEMKRFADSYHFERAQMLKNKIDILHRFQSRTTIINPQLKDIEVYTILQKEGINVVNYLNVSSGVIIQSYNLELKNQLEEELPELLSYAIAEIRSRLRSTSKNVIVNIMPDFLIDNLNYSAPQRGEKRNLVDLSLRNCAAYIDELIKRDDLKNPQNKVDRLLQKIKDDLHLLEFPVQIECFDNSNLQGTNPVAACVVFKNAKPSKRDYRHFNIKTVEGPDDFASMREVVHRRYSRLLEENQSLPQLVIIDGGKGQLSAAFESIHELGLSEKIKLIGIAKRLEEIYFPGDSVPLYLDKRSETLKVIQQARDEAHRFGVKHHTSRRSKGAISSSLDGINGIGPKTVEQLFSTFKSIDGIKKATREELISLIGAKKADILLSHFSK
ncbi:MAG TPA: excinuclease ABC subunit UvrC [Tenuifilaceae bacterium]|nr:excinuclease ABC subunit UvrC [Tenuifilaceae bacterium]HPI43758.1 excinuclease ABC subunit UvrC [Tenuifilaceae bacterium]HPN20314.1 excinuclease ABC subunit UvrC [Tenuifilaceae bacterium]HPV55775.1 excinuclease ABC subunit UvrC [Tenuifilaceae bacterium]